MSVAPERSLDWMNIWISFIRFLHLLIVFSFIWSNDAGDACDEDAGMGLELDGELVVWSSESSNSYKKKDFCVNSESLGFFYSPIGPG